MFRIGLLAVIALVPALAQSLNVNFEAFAAKAKEKAEVNLDGAALDAAKKSMPEAAKLKDVQAVSVHHYEYEKAGEYPKEELAKLRSQVEHDARWKRIVSVREGEEATDIYLSMTSGKMDGLLVINAEAKEVSIVEARGTLELASMQEVVQSAIQYNMASVEAGAPAGK